MSFPKYPKYKDSGVEWLGDVPKHWEVKVLKHIVSTPITDGPHETPDFPDEGIPFVSAEAVAFGTIDFTKIRGFISEDDHKRYSEKYRPRIGDVYMVKSGATTGVTAIVETDREFNIWSPLAAIRCGDQALPRFILNFLRSRNFQEGVTLNWSFGTQQNIGMRVIENLAVSLPPVPEQIAIASFLDAETSRIDALIAEQRRLIELLKEKRQAVISHAVTKGLNPNAPMKPSGIEWLGDVPEHWTRSQPKHFTTKIVDGVHFKPNYVDDGIPFVTVQNLTAGRGISFENHNYISKEDHDEYFKRANPQKADVLITKDGTLGVVRVVETDRVFSIFVSVALLKPIQEFIDPWFMAHALESDVVYQQFSARQLGSALKHIHLVELRNVFVMLPPLEEQHEIVQVLRGKVGRLETLLAEAERAIELLQERRTALISAAVTGKIDVREFASVEAA